ncbi:unnamed protein product [Sphagnum tenellum]
MVMFLTDTQLVLLKIIDIETFCDLETDLDFGRDEIFARTDQLRIKRNSEDAENQRLKDLDDLCALLCHNMSPDISLVILNLIISRYEVHGAVGLPHFLKDGALVDTFGDPTDAETADMFLDEHNVVSEEYETGSITRQFPLSIQALIDFEARCRLKARWGISLGVGGRAYDRNMRHLAADGLVCIERVGGRGPRQKISRLVLTNEGRDHLLKLGYDPDIEQYVENPGPQYLAEVRCHRWNQTTRPDEKRQAKRLSDASETHWRNSTINRRTY